MDFDGGVNGDVVVDGFGGAAEELTEEVCGVTKVGVMEARWLCGRGSVKGMKVKRECEVA